VVSGGAGGEFDLCRGTGERDMFLDEKRGTVDFR